MPRSKPNASAGRRGLLGKVHIAKKQMEMDDEAYRAILAGRFGVESSADLSVSDLEKLVLHFKKLGWREAAPAKRRASGSPARATEAQIAAIKSRWTRFARNPSWEACEAWLLNFAKVRRVEWLTREQASKAIHALDKMVEGAA